MNAGYEDRPGREPARSDLETPARTLRNHSPLILACVALAAMVALGASLIQPKEYTASASLLFRDPGFAQNLFGTNFQAQTDPAREAATNVKLVGLAIVAQRTAEALGDGLTADEVRSQIDVSGEGNSDVVSVSATGGSPAQAQRTANTFAREFIAFRAGADRSKLIAAKRLADRQLEDLSPLERDGRRGEALSSVADRLGVLASLQTGNAELVQPAELPTSPSSPRPLRNAILGALLGALFGIGLAFLSERLRQRLRDPGDAEAAFGLPVVGTIPKSRMIAAGVDQLPFVEEESFRTLRAALRYFNVDRDLRSVVVTSGEASEGKSTVAWNLAKAAAPTKRTVLVEADLRQPSLSIVHPLFPSPGLAEMLTGQVSFHDARQSLLLEPGVESSALDLIVAGAMPPNPADLLESEAMATILAQLARSYEFVVIDTPPTGVVSDAFSLLNQVDGVLLVCRLGRTTRKEAVATREQLNHLNAPLLGVVTNCTRPKRHRQPYGYAYADLAPLPEDRPVQSAAFAGSPANEEGRRAA